MSDVVRGAWLLLALFLGARASGQDPAEPPDDTRVSLQIVVPFEFEEGEALQRWLDAQQGELALKATVETVNGLVAKDLAPQTLLFGFERGFLEGLEHDGVLAPLPERGAVVSVAWESWTPVWSTAGDNDVPEIRGWKSLTEDALHGHLRVRRVTLDGVEGLVLGEAALRLGLSVDGGLDRLVLASREAGTLLDPAAPMSRILRTLPGGTATIAPVRAVVFARRAGARVSYTVPEEGFIGLELAAALTLDSTADAIAAVEHLLAPQKLKELCRQLELEPFAPADATAPRWIAAIEARRLPLDRDAADRMRTHLAELYAAAPPRFALPEAGFWLDLLETLLLTAALLVVLVALRRSGKGPRDRRAGPFV